MIVSRLSNFRSPRHMQLHPAFSAIFTFAIGIASSSPAQLPDAESILSTFDLDSAFEIELVAAEPVIVDPVDLEFDERGRPFAIEMPGYPFPNGGGHVVLLKDDDQDGYYETRVEFADDFPVADSIMPYQGGILVASPPDLIYLKDTDGDDVADMRETLLTGFAVENPQHNFNGLQYNVDNWIYGASGGNGGNVHWPGHPDEEIPLRYDDFRIDLGERHFERIGRSTGGFELAIDDWGRIFGTHNLVHIRHLVFSGRYVEDLPTGRPGTLADISDHEEGGTARIFPIGVQETRVNHPEQSGYFSGACGITYYGGGAFPHEYNGNVFVCDVVLNLVHRDVLHEDGVTFVASRADGRRDFLASTDRAFRPVNLTVGPDGALYVVDIHRAVIEHPEWIPDEIEEGLDLEAGKQQGRIFRITPRGGLARKPPAFDRNDPAAVVAHLTDANKWVRDTAQRLLVEWNDDPTVDPLKTMLRNAEDPRVRMHALWTLDGIDRLGEDDLTAALSDTHPGVREHAVRVAESRFSTDQSLVALIADMVSDQDTRVRMQVALTLGHSPEAATPEVTGSLVEIARQDAGDPWMRLALLSALDAQPRAAFQTLIARSDFSRIDGAAELLSDLAELISADSGVRGGEFLVAAIHHADTPADFAARLLEGLADGVERASEDARTAEDGAVRTALETMMNSEHVPLVRAALRVASALGIEPGETQRRLLDQARQIASDGSASKNRRLEHLDLLALADFSTREDVLFGLLDTKQPKEIQRSAMAQLADVGAPEVAKRLLSVWNTLGPELRARAGDVLLYNRRNHDLLFDALESGDIMLGEMNLDLERRRILLRSDRARAEALFSDAGVVTRQAALDQFRPAIELRGDATKGHRVYLDLCSKCHQISGEGNAIGPDLTDVFRKSAETLLHDIIDPNAAAETGYVGYAIETGDGRLISGIVVDETDDAVTIREAEGKETVIHRDDIVEMYSDGLSFMPEELETDLPLQIMADLIAFLQQPR